MPSDQLGSWLPALAMAGVACLLLWGLAVGLVVATWRWAGAMVRLVDSL